MADLIGDGASTAEMSRNARPPSLREIATRALAPFLGGGGGRVARPLALRRPPCRELRRKNSSNHLSRTAHNSAGVWSTNGPGCGGSRTRTTLPLPPWASCRSPTFRPEVGVTEEMFRDVQRRFAKCKSKQRGETAAAKRSRERGEALAFRAIMEMSECPYGFAWFHDGDMWECRGARTPSV